MIHVFEKFTIFPLWSFTFLGILGNFPFSLYGLDHSGSFTSYPMNGCGHHTYTHTLPKLVSPHEWRKYSLTPTHGIRIISMCNNCILCHLQDVLCAGFQYTGF